MSEARKTLRDRDGSAGSSSAVLICLVVFAAVFIVYTTRYLSEPVAVHFGTGNQADGWMSRNGYLIFMLSFMIGMTAFITFVVGTLPAKFPQWTNVPNRDYWLAPKRRDESLRYLSAHGKRLGYLIVMMMLGMHYTILLANHTRPPSLPVPVFTSILIGFAVALIWWIVRLYRRFPRPK
ncbi:MAG TPA: DUF1648 domain-containing protein [Candidatus Binatia bacterium]|jgi:hypothetical protein